MKKISRLFSILFVIVSLIGSLVSCCYFPEPTEWEYYSFKNNSSDTIYVWESLCSPKIDVLKKEYPLYKSDYYVVTPGARKDSLYMGIPEEDLNVHFKYKPERDYSNEDVVNIVILKKETYDKYSLDQLIEDEIYDAKYVLRKMDILEKGYVVTYQ